jgi:hypothetical protein
MLFISFLLPPSTDIVTLRATRWGLWEKEVASMRHVLLLLVVAAMMLTLTAGPALAAPTGAPLNENNCFGAGSSEFVAGPGGNPGSKVNPSEEFNNFNGPFTSNFAKTNGGTAVGEAQPGTGHLNCTGPGAGTQNP